MVDEPIEDGPSNSDGSFSGSMTLRSAVELSLIHIFPDAVKIGMPGTTELIQIIAERLRHYQAKHIVVDPVMLSVSYTHLDVYKRQEHGCSNI